jgi:MFS family permease
MYAPSFFTGSLIQRFGVRQVMMTGAVILVGAALVNISGLEIERFWLGLVMLGVGWNFMFVGGTSLLAECHSPEERAKVQGLNDFLVFGTVTVSSFASGALLNAFGWNAVNYGVLPLLAIAGSVIAVALWRQRSPV